MSSLWKKPLLKKKCEASERFYHVHKLIYQLKKELAIESVKHVHSWNAKINLSVLCLAGLFMFAKAVAFFILVKRSVSIKAAGSPITTRSFNRETHAKFLHYYGCKYPSISLDTPSSALSSEEERPLFFAGSCRRHERIPQRSRPSPTLTDERRRNQLKPARSERISMETKALLFIFKTAIF